MDLASAKAGAKLAEQSTGLLTRVLGPTADVLGLQLADWTNQRLGNLQKVAKNAESKGVKSEGRRVSLRVARKVLEEGSYAETDVLVEYLGGILATSSTIGGADDRGAAWSDLVARTATYDLRLHYIIYREAHRLTFGREINLYDSTEVHENARLYLPFTGLVEAMGLNDNFSQAEEIVYGSLMNLERDDLSKDTIAGNKETLAFRLSSTFEDAGVLVTPTSRGFSLFLWALGRGDIRMNDVFGVNPDEIDVADIPRVEGALLFDQSMSGNEAPEPAL